MRKAVVVTTSILVDDIIDCRPAKRSTRATYWNQNLMIHSIDHADLVGGRPISDAIVNAAQQLLQIVTLWGMANSQLYCNLCCLQATNI